jgi:hypothetical protein
VQADYYGLLSTAFFQFPSPPGSYNAIIDGQFLLCSLLQPVSLPNATQGTGYNPVAIEITDNLNVVLNPATDVTSNGTYGYLLYTTPYTLKLYSMANSVSPDVIWGGLLAYPQSGAAFLLNATRPGIPVSVNYYTQSFASNLASSRLLTSVTVERYVHIDISSYTVYLTVWSMGT